MLTGRRMGSGCWQTACPSHDDRDYDADLADNDHCHDPDDDHVMILMMAMMTLTSIQAYLHAGWILS